MKIDQRTAAAALAVTLALAVSPDVALAQAGDISTGINNGYNWALAAVRVLCACFVLGGFAMFAVGRFAWQSGMVMLVGLLGAAKSAAISAYLFGS